MSFVRNGVPSKAIRSATAAVLLMIAAVLTCVLNSSPAAAADLIVTSPSDYAVVSGTSVTISGTVSANYSSGVTVNGSAANLTAEGVWSKTITLSSGENVITIRAFGSSGETSKVLHLISASGAPQITFTIGGASSATVTTASIAISATVFNGETFDVLLNGSSVPFTATAGADPSYTTVAATITTLQPGSNTITVTAENNGQTTAKTVSVTYDNAPVLVIDSPENGYTSTDQYITVSGEAGNYDQLTFYLNGSLDTANPVNVNGQSFSKQMSALKPGENTIEVRAIADGRTTSRTVTVYYSPAVPTIFNLNVPLSPSTATSYTGTMTITGTVRQATTLTVQDVTGTPGTTLQTLSYINPEADNSFSVTVSLHKGTTTSIRLTAAGPNGTSTADLKLNWELGSRIVLTAPKAVDTCTSIASVSVDSPSSNQLNIKGLLENVATGSANATISVNGKTSVALNHGSFDTTVTLSAGTNKIVLKAVSPTGQTTSVTLQVAYNLGPQLTITSPTGNASSSDPARVSQASATIIGTAVRASSLQLKLTDSAGTVTTYTPSLTSLGGFSQTLTLKPGTNTVELTAADGNAGTTKTLTFLYDDTPAVSVTEPAEGTTISTNSITVTGTVWNVQTNGLIINGEKVSFSSNGKFSHKMSLNPSGTTVTLEIQGINGSRVTNKTVTYQYSGSPEVSITSHDDGDTVYSNTITIKGKILGVGLPLSSTDKITVNSLEADVDLEDGTFSREITLKKGSNTIAVSVKLSKKSLSKSIKLEYSELPQEGAYYEVTPGTKSSTIKLFGDQASFAVPQNAFPSDATISFEILDSGDVSKDSDTIYVSKILRYEGEDPLKPVPLSIKYIDGLRDSLLPRLGIYRYEDDEWTSIGGKVDAKKKTVTAEVTEKGTYAVLAYVSSFGDIAGHWAQDDIEILMAKGVLEGSGGSTFGPDRGVTRAEFAKMVVKALNIPLPDEEYSSFDDVGRHSWASPYIEAAVRAGIIKGTGDRRFSPDQYVTRLQAAIMMARADNLKDVSEKEALTILGGFRDGFRVGYNRNLVAAAVKAGLIKGTNSITFSPGAVMTRAQAAKLLTRLMVLQKKI